jgi:UDPglucose--hexose-1-phosphate uridylyltransferase
VIIGGERGGRPNEFVEAATRASGLTCPFCSGHEDETPPAIATYGSNGKATWLVRVVPNKFPAVTTDQPSGFGQHEVIVESPRHVASLSELNDAEGQAVFQAYRDRLREIKAEGPFRYVQIFKNVGPAAGASLEHVHSQLVALKNVPDVVQQELDSCREFFKQQGRSLLVDMLNKEVTAGERIVAQTEHFVAWCPYASRFGYETWIAPREHRPRFEDMDSGELGELSRMARDLIGRIERATGHVAYNYFLHSQPFDMPAYDHYHWHIEIIPRLTKVAGFEWGTGCFINPYSPEAAAEHLRAV